MIQKSALFLQIILFVAVPMAAQNGSIQEFAVNPTAANPESFDYSADFSSAPDGSIWILGLHSLVYQVSPGGKVTSYQLPESAQASSVFRIAIASDGSLWYLSQEPSGTFIGRVGSDGSSTRFPAPNGTSSLTPGADGSIWITEAAAIDKVLPSGAIVKLPVAFNSPQNIITGEDGALWYSGSGVIGRTTIDGTTESFQVNAYSQKLVSVGGKIWFLGASNLGYLGPDGGVTYIQTSILQDPQNPNWFLAEDFAAAPNGGLWVAMINGVLLHIDRSGGFTEVRVPHPESPDWEASFYQPHQVLVLADGSVWFSTYGNTEVGVLKTPFLQLSTAGTARVLPQVGKGFSAALARISDTEDVEAGDLRVNVDWGDGFSSGAQIESLSEYTHSFTVKAQHSYGRPGPESVVLTATDLRNRLGARLAFKVNVAQDAAARIDEYRVGWPLALTMGADGAIWFTNVTTPSFDYSLGRLSINGSLSGIPLPDDCCFDEIASASDGALWLGDSSYNSPRLDRYASGTLSPANGSGVITGGNLSPDGSGGVYATSGVSILHFHNDGSFDPLPLNENWWIGGIGTDLQGRLWYASRMCGEAGFSDSLGSSFWLEIGVNTPQYAGCGAVASTDGAGWIAQNQLLSPAITRVESSGSTVQFEVGGGPVEQMTNALGEIWYTDPDNHRIGELNKDGSYQVYDIPVSPNGTGPHQLTFGADGNIWFSTSDSIGVLRLGRQSFVANPIPATKDTSFGGVIARFHDTQPLNSGDLRCTIDWGDGTRSRGEITGTTPDFLVSGSHSYPRSGEFLVNMSLQKFGMPAAFFANTNAKVDGSPLVISSYDSEAFAGRLTRFILASVTYADQSHSPVNLSAIIRWDDGSVSRAMLDSAFRVVASHRFLEVGQHAAVVTVTNSSGASVSGTSLLRVVNYRQPCRRCVHRDYGAGRSVFR